MKMKDSGVAWIGKIPADHNIVRNKYLVRLLKGKLPCDTNQDGEGVPYIGASEMDSNTEARVFTTDASVPRCVESDVLLLWDGARAGLVGTGRKGALSSTVAKCILDKKIFPKFWYWYLKGFEWFLATNVHGTTIPHMSSEYLEAVNLIDWTILEQRRIVDYLDEKTAEIDSRVAVLERKLAAYKRLKASVINRAVTRGLDSKAKLKDSGDEWIGMIPVGWDGVRVESHYDVQLGKMLSAKQSDASEIMLEYVCAANVHYDGVSLNGLKQMWYLPKEVETFRVKTGDLLVVEGGAGAGGCSVVENVDRVVCMQNSILRIRPTSTGSNRYLNYWFNDLGHRGYIGWACNVATIPHFTKEKMRQTPMPYPPPAEQRAIADYLDAECAKIDKAAELVTREIELYRKLKRSLINEVVTGKRLVS